MTYKKILEGIITKNGFKHQATVCIEELAELTKELTKLLRDKGSSMRLAEEIADVEICLAQVKMFMGPDRKHIPIFKSFKSKRLEAFFLEGNYK